MDKSTDTKSCHFCKKPIPKDAKVCPYCGKKQIGIVYSIIFLVIVLFILISIIKAFVGGISHTHSTPPPVVSTTTSAPTAVPETEEQKIGDIATSAVQGVKEISYRDVQIEDDTYERPAGSKMATVNFNVASFDGKASLLSETGPISAKTFQGVFKENPNMADAFIWYYGDVTDQYGNEKNDVILTYTIDRATFEKINWSNFDQSTFCNFLEEENTRNGDNMDTGCKVLADMK